MKKTPLIFWLIILTLVCSFVYLGIDFDGYDLTEGGEKSDLLFTVKTEKYSGKYELPNHYEHRGIGFKMKNRAVSFCVGIFAPILTMLLALLFGRIVTKHIERLSASS